MNKEYRFVATNVGSFFNSQQVYALQVLNHYPDGPPDYNGLPTHLAYTKWEYATAQDLIDYANCQLRR